ncbi:MAG: addiction module protein [bacterium]|nr:addiction module protein [bacterium]
MTASTKKVVSDAMSLPADARALLADKLLHSLDSPEREEIDRLWAEEAERRVQQIESGEVTPIPGEDVFKEIRETILS